MKQSVVKIENLSKWYGKVLGLCDVSMDIEPGIHGLLGPNGAGKSTLLKILTGALKPSLGKVEIFGGNLLKESELFRRIGYCPEFDTFYTGVSAYEFLCFCAETRLRDKVRAEENSKEALNLVGLYENRKRRISTFSLGMRQRLKLAFSIMHSPDLLILDEPLRGIDPLWRVKIIEMLKEDFVKKDKTVIVSSHILPEIEAMTDNIILINQGRVFARGGISEIRDLLDQHPHEISLKCSKPREVGVEMIKQPYVLDIQFDDAKQCIIMKTDKRDLFFTRLMNIIKESRIEVYELLSTDSNLQAVFDYLIGRQNG